MRGGRGKGSGGVEGVEDGQKVACYRDIVITIIGRLTLINRLTGVVYNRDRLLELVERGWGEKGWRVTVMATQHAWYCIVLY